MTETTTSHSGDVRILAPAVVREIISERTCHAALPNGKIVFGFIDQPGLTITEGAKVKISLNLCDFSKGEIVCTAE